MNTKLFLFGLVLFVITTQGCVSKKKFDALNQDHTILKSKYEELIKELARCNEETKIQKVTINDLKDEIKELKSNAHAMLNQLSDLAVMTKEQAESVRKSIDLIQSKDFYINNLQNEMARKDSLNLLLMRNLKRELIDENDEDIQINVEGSAVFISISDKMLFNTASYTVSSQAMSVLRKVAKVINEHPDLDFMVEGHADNRSISTEFLRNNWDLSVMRATSVVRILERDLGVDPKRMIAAGRGEHIPAANNDSKENMQQNRRTRIIILPQLDQFFKILSE